MEERLGKDPTLSFLTCSLAGVKSYLDRKGNITMKMKTKIALVVGIATLAVTPAFAAKGGTDMLHYSIREALTDTGVEPGAAGTVSINESVQGNANSQKLDVNATGLTADTDYDIVVNVNGTGSVNLGTFTTDGKGKLGAHLVGSSKGPGKKTPLPDEFDASQIIGLDVVNGSSQAVLSVDTTAPASLKYMVRRNLNNGGTANGTLTVSSSKGNSKFSLTASGLDADTDYQLVFNGAPVGTFTSDGHGKLKINDASLLPENVLDLQTVEVWDSTNTAVLGTTTPLP